MWGCMLSAVLELNILLRNRSNEAYSTHRYEAVKDDVNMVLLSGLSESHALLGQCSSVQALKVTAQSTTAYCFSWLAVSPPYYAALNQILFL